MNIPQFNWQAADVKAGRIVCRANRSKEKWFPEGWRAKWTHKIGFVPGDGEDSGQTGQYCLIAMSDGLVYWRGASKEEMASQLTRRDMIPMPWSWWLKMVRHLRSQTNPK